MKPFLKWIGGKYKILNRVLDALPYGRRLIEPFAGSGAIFLNAGFEENLICDLNTDLINLYKQVQIHGKDFVAYASTLFTPDNNIEGAYYVLRDEYNSCMEVSRKSALFVYLNRHCFNGKMRYNSKGRFNSPFGWQLKRSPIFPEVEMLNFFWKSKRAIFECASFIEVMKKADIGSVVYCDPPYSPSAMRATFTGYTSQGFTLTEQQELADCAKELAVRGIPVVISNLETEFTRSLYADAKIISFDVRHSPSGHIQGKNKVGELLAIYAFQKPLS